MFGLHKSNFIPSVSTGFVEFEYIAHTITSYVIEHYINNLLCLFFAFYMHGSRKCRHGDGRDPKNFFSHQGILQRTVRTSLEKQLDPTGPIASRAGSVLVFLRKHITN